LRLKFLKFLLLLGEVRDRTCPSAQKPQTTCRPRPRRETCRRWRHRPGLASGPPHSRGANSTLHAASARIQAALLDISHFRSMSLSPDFWISPVSPQALNQEKQKVSIGAIRFLSN
jgi:hypothetical protein